MTEHVFRVGDRVHRPMSAAWRKDMPRALARITRNLGTVTHVDERDGVVTVSWDTKPDKIRRYEPSQLSHQNIIARLGGLSDDG